MKAWFLYALGSAFFAGLTAIFGKIGVKNINSDMATFIRTIVIIFVIGFILTLKKEWQSLGHLDNQTWIFLILSGVATGASWLCYYKALQIGEASRVAPVDKLSVVFVIFLSLLFLGEKLTIKTAIGSLLILSGTVFMAIA